MSHHLLRFGMLLFVLLILAVTVNNAARRSAIGQDFSVSLLYVCYWFLALFGSLHFCSAITEEKEEGMLPLLRMTGADSLTILAGKSLPRLLMPVLLLLTIAPFIMLSITLGGVLLTGIVRGILGLLCFAFALSQLGLLASVFFRTTRAAFVATCFLWSFLELLPTWVYLLSLGSINTNRSEAWLLEEASLCSNMGTSVIAYTDDQLWTWQMVIHTTVGIICFLVAWLRFAWQSRQADQPRESSTPIALRFGRPRVANDADALTWKTFQLVGGGVPGLILRGILMPMLLFGVSFILSMQSNFGSQWWTIAQNLIPMAVLYGGLILWIDGGRVLRNDIEVDRLETVRILPGQMHNKMWMMLKGVLPGISLAFLPFFGAALISCLSSLRTGSGEAVLIAFLWFAQLFSLVWVTFCNGLLLTTVWRHAGMLTAIILYWVVGPFAVGCCFAFCAFSTGGGGTIVLAFLIPIALMIAQMLSANVFLERTVNNMMQISESA